MKIVIGTKNDHKIKEFKKEFEKIGIEVVGLQEYLKDKEVAEPIEDGKTFEENASIKAKYYYEITKMPCVCDDSGICVEILNGEPGINSARYSGGNDKDNRDFLRQNLKGMFPAKAYFNCDLIYYDGKEIISTNGKIYGEIIDEERGEDGFGYDCIFYYPPYEKTLSEISMEEKNKISHRGQAIEEMLKKLKEKYNN
jgi:XTP/dITP diphosphohydrolase